jgi:hypothetical protein
MALSLNGVGPGCMNPITVEQSAQISYMIMTIFITTLLIMTILITTVLKMSILITLNTADNTFNDIAYN